MPQFALEFLRKIAEQNSRSDSDSDSDEEEYNLFRIEKAQKKKGTTMIELLCWIKNTHKLKDLWINNPNLEKKMMLL